MDDVNDDEGPDSGAEHPAADGPAGPEPSALERVLHGARALVLADLDASGVVGAEVVSLVEASVSHRRWWVEQWPDGMEYVAGLVAQDVQDALLERYGRWPLCPVCATVEPHAMEVEPELGPDPHWVCAKEAVVVAAVGALNGTGPAGPPGATGPATPSDPS